jgi:hypothetical protein
VALLFIHDDGTSSVAHVDLAVPDRVYIPNHDWEAGFEVALEAFQTPIVEQDLLEEVGKLREQTYNDLDALKEASLPLCHPCWTGERRYITRADLLSEIEHSTRIVPTDKEKVVAILSGRAG